MRDGDDVNDDDDGDHAPCNGAGHDDNVFSRGAYTHLKTP